MIILHHIHAPCSNNMHIWTYMLFSRDIILPENVTLFHIASLFKIEITMPESTNKFKSYKIYTMSNKNQELKIF